MPARSDFETRLMKASVLRALQVRLVASRLLPNLVDDSLESDELVARVFCVFSRSAFSRYAVNLNIRHPPRVETTSPDSAQRHSSIRCRS